MSALRFDGRGVWPWLLVALYTLGPFALMLSYFDNDGRSFETALGLLGVTLMLGALGPFLVVFFAYLAVPVFLGDVPYLDCKTLGEEAIVYGPIVLALPLACMVTSVVIYHLGRSALAANSRILGNLVFPFVGLAFGWATLWLMSHRIAVALEKGQVCSGG